MHHLSFKVFIDLTYLSLHQSINLSLLFFSINNARVFPPPPPLLLQLHQEYRVLQVVFSVYVHGYASKQRKLMETPPLLLLKKTLATTNIHARRQNPRVWIILGIIFKVEAAAVALLLFLLRYTV